MITFHKNSILIRSLNTDTDQVKCWFIFLVTWNVFKGSKQTFDIDQLDMTGIIKFYDTLADDWDRKYRVRGSGFNPNKSTLHTVMFFVGLFIFVAFGLWLINELAGK